MANKFLTKDDLASSGILYEIDLYFADYCEDLSDERVWILAAIVSNRSNNQHSAFNANLYNGKLVGDLFAGVNEDISSLLLPDFSGVEHSSKIGQANAITPIVYENGYFYMNRYRRYEENFCNFIKSKSQIHEINEITKKSLDELFPDNLVAGAPNWQKVAAMSALMHDFAIISGGPGTGKTTTIGKVLALLQQGEKKLRIQLLAPTGKAAERLNESLNKFKQENQDSKIAKVFDSIAENAMTIHRFLNICKRHNYHLDASAPFDLILIDEASMVSLELFAILVQVISQKCRIILLGDKDQLASVENGSVLNDLSKLQAANTFSKSFINNLPELQLKESNKQTALSDKMVQLKHSYRFKSNRGIGVLSGFVNELESEKNALEQIDEIIENSDELEWCDLSLEQVLKIALRKMAQFKKSVQDGDLEESFLQLGKFRVLCAMNEGKFGVANVNKLLAQHLHGEVEQGFYHGQPIIITENDYNLKLMNGDVGLIFRNEEGEIYAWFKEGDNFKSINPTALGPHSVAFALSVHKSQGSEFDNIVLLLPDNDNRIISKELIYTGITRAKKHCTIFADRELFLLGCLRKTVRESGLRKRLEKIE